MNHTAYSISAENTFHESPCYQQRRVEEGARRRRSRMRVTAGRMGVKHPFQDRHIRVQTQYRGACSEHQYPELLHKKPRRRNQIEGSPPYLRWCWGVDTESQFLPDGIFKHRRRPYAKMGHLKRKADTSTHIPPPLGLSGHRSYSGIWDRSRKATPFTNPHIPSTAPPAHCGSTRLTGLLHQPHFSVESKTPHRNPAFSLLRSYS